MTTAAFAPDTRTTQPVRQEPVRLQRIRAEFLEMPGLTLTVAQAARLWAVDTIEAKRLLAELSSTGFLMRNAAGSYRRRDCPRCA